MWHLIPRIIDRRRRFGDPRLLHHFIDSSGLNILVAISDGYFLNDACSSGSGHRRLETNWRARAGPVTAVAPVALSLVYRAIDAFMCPASCVASRVLTVWSSLLLRLSLRLRCRGNNSRTTMTSSLSAKRTWEERPSPPSRCAIIHRGQRSYKYNSTFESGLQADRCWSAAFYERVARATATGVRLASEVTPSLALIVSFGTDQPVWWPLTVTGTTARTTPGTSSALSSPRHLHIQLTLSCNPPL